MVQCSLGLVFKFFGAITLLASAACGILYIREIDKVTNSDTILDTCDTRNLSGDDCVSTRNGNALFALAVISSLVCLFAFILLLGFAELSFIKGRMDFVLTWAGRGVSMFIVGLMALGIAGDFGIACGISNMILGPIFFLYHFCAPKTA